MSAACSFVSSFNVHLNVHCMHSKLRFDLPYVKEAEPVVSADGKPDTLRSDARCEKTNKRCQRSTGSCH